MNSSDIQIKNAYEVENMSPEEISSDLGFDVVAVKSKLMQVSSKFRKACGQESEEESNLNFSSDDLQRVNQEILQLALGAENEKVRADMCKYVRDDKKGRKDVVKAMANGPTNNFLIFNEALRNARVNAQESIRKFIDVGHGNGEGKTA